VSELAFVSLFHDILGFALEKDWECVFYGICPPEYYEQPRGSSTVHSFICACNAVIGDDDIKNLNDTKR